MYGDARARASVCVHVVQMCLHEPDQGTPFPHDLTLVGKHTASVSVVH